MNSCADAGPPAGGAGVARDASAEEVKRAYRQLALTLHPDKTGGDAAAAALFQRVSFAYSVLSDAHKKRYYDETGARAPRRAATRGRWVCLARSQVPACAAVLCTHTGAAS